MAPRDTKTLDLLAWTPPRAPVPVVAEEVSRSATLGGRLCRLMALVLRESDKTRDDVAQTMSDYLGETVSPSMLDKYVAESATDHVINIIRYIALIHATGDMRLLQGLADIFAYAVIPERFVPAIEESLLRDQMEQLNQRLAMATKSWKGARP